MEKYERLDEHSFPDCNFLEFHCCISCNIMYYLQFMFLFIFQFPIPNSCFQFTNSIFMIGRFFLKVFRKQCKNSKMHKVHASIITIHCVVIIAQLNKYYFVLIVKQHKKWPKINLFSNLDLTCTSNEFIILSKFFISRKNKPTPKLMFPSSQSSILVFGHFWQRS